MNLEIKTEFRNRNLHCRQNKWKANYYKSLIQPYQFHHIHSIHWENFCRNSQNMYLLKAYKMLNKNKLKSNQTISTYDSNNSQFSFRNKYENKKIFSNTFTQTINLPSHKQTQIQNQFKHQNIKSNTLPNNITIKQYQNDQSNYAMNTKIQQLNMKLQNLQFQNDESNLPLQLFQQLRDIKEDNIKYQKKYVSQMDEIIRKSCEKKDKDQDNRVNNGSNKNKLMLNKQLNKPIQQKLKKNKKSIQSFISQLLK